jgi:hypothetical protein
VSASRTDIKTNAQVAKTVRSRRRQLRRQRWYALVISLGALAAIVCLATNADISATIPFLASSGNPVPISNRGETRTGTIVHEGDAARCEKIKFDNDSGRIIELSASCDNRVVLDAHGVPVPLGTGHRLDEISKSFSGR